MLRPVLSTYSSSCLRCHRPSWSRKYSPSSPETHTLSSSVTPLYHRPSSTSLYHRLMKPYHPTLNPDPHPLSPSKPHHSIPIRNPSSPCNHRFHLIVSHPPPSLTPNPSLSTRGNKHFLPLRPVPQSVLRSAPPIAPESVPVCVTLSGSRRGESEAAGVTAGPSITPLDCNCLESQPTS